MTTTSLFPTFPRRVFDAASQRLMECQQRIVDAEKERKADIEQYQQRNAFVRFFSHGPTHWMPTLEYRSRMYDLKRQRARAERLLRGADHAAYAEQNCLLSGDDIAFLFPNRKDAG